MYRMPKLEIDEVPLLLDCVNGITFAKKGEDVAFHADFEVNLLSDGEDFEIDEIWMGEQRLRARAFTWARQNLEERHSSFIWDHIHAHLEECKAEAQFQAERVD